MGLVQVTRMGYAHGECITSAAAKKTGRRRKHSGSIARLFKEKTVTVEQDTATREENAQIEVVAKESSYEAIEPEVFATLHRLSKRDSHGKFEVGEENLRKVKEAIKGVLNVPAQIELHIFSDSKGSAVSLNKRGESLIEGHFTLFSNSNRATHIGFVFNSSSKELFVDGRQVSRAGVPLLLAGIKKSLDEPAPLAEVLGRVSARAQTIFFKGTIARNKGDIHIVITHNYIEPFDFHVYVGTEKKMTPIKLISESGIRNNLGTFLKGKLPSDEVVVLFIPFRREDKLFISPSMNGIAIAEEPVKGSSAVSLTRNVST